MNGARLPDDFAQTAAYESGRAAGLAAVAEMQRAAPLESTQKAWLLGFLRGAIDAAGRPDAEEWLKSHDVEEWLRNHNERLKTPSQTLSASGPQEPARKSPTRAGVSACAVRVSAIEAYGHSPEGQHEWLSVALDADERRAPFPPGSSLALWPSNDPDDVRRVLRMLDVSAQLLVESERGTEPAWQALLERVDISNTPRNAIRLLAEFSRSESEAKSLIAIAEGPTDVPRPLLTLLRRYPSARPPLESLLKCLSPLKPSFVPIASSFLEQTKPLLVTVQSGSGEAGWGQVGGAIRSKLRVGEWLSASVDEHDFPAMLNTDDLEPAIIIADGPCVALARAFVAERHERQAKGRTWVIVTGVGTTQFPYARTLSAWHRSGSLTRFDVAPGFDASDIVRTLGEHEENLWRWFVDHSRLFVVARRQSMRTAITEWFVGLLARRCRLEHNAATQRLRELSDQGQWVTLPQFAVAS